MDPSTVSGHAINQPLMSSLPLKAHISYKVNEVELLRWEAELMKHYKLNRSDLHKHFIRMHYHMLRFP